uniref:Activating molecule in BECN1-regulated autophagy protein 1 n=1 Tax=Homo sapiens TaxID=9606 RepID=UPI002AC9F237|nr:Chain B, Activating molecule in BECN1-regulated autophagy protein 1 [Homo sapiens]
MKVVPEKNAVRILWGRERGARAMGAQRLLQELVEDKTRWMKWEGKRVELPDSPRSTFLLAFSPDRTLLASTHVNHNIYITEVKTGKCVHSLIGHRRTPWCVTFHPTISGLIASGCLDGEVRIWDLHGGSESWFTDSNNAIASLAFHPTAQLLLIATANEIHFWDWSRREPFAVVKTASEMERVRLVRFDPLGHYLLTAIVNPSNSNIANTTYRLQWWDFTKFDLPEISNASVNVLVQNCKIYNDASCDISADGQLLAAFIPSSQRGFPDEGILAVYSLAPHNLGEMLYTKRFGPNAISVSLSPMGRYVMVGLASRRILLHPSTEHMVAQVFRLQQAHGGETSMRRVFNVLYPMPADQRRHVSINSARWLPEPGLGLAYGTNKGDLVICRPEALNSG